MLGNSIGLSLKRGPLCVSAAGVVTVSVSPVTTYLAYPYAPNPYHAVQQGEYIGPAQRTNGITLLRDVYNGTTEPGEIRAGWELLCILLTTPDGLRLRDLVDLRERTDGCWVLKPEGLEDRLSVPPRTVLVFDEHYNDRLDVYPLEDLARDAWSTGGACYR